MSEQSRFPPRGYKWSYLYPAETSLYLQLLHQLSSLANAHGAVHWGVSFHPDHKHKHNLVNPKKTVGPIDKTSSVNEPSLQVFDLEYSISFLSAILVLVPSNCQILNSNG